MVACWGYADIEEQKDPTCFLKSSYVHVNYYKVTKSGVIEEITKKGCKVNGKLI